MGTGKLIAGENPAMDWHPIQEGFEILLVASCYRNWDKLWPNGPLSLSLPWSHFELNDVSDLFSYRLQSVFQAC